jgi:ribose transport system ATP-binding protein
MTVTGLRTNDGPPIEATGPLTRMSVGGLFKSFGGTHALQDFQFDLHNGEVHALVGGNGSGKSTFIKVLAGIHSADAGHLSTPDRTWDLSQHSPDQARSAGLRFVHQDLGIFPILSLADNLAIGRGFLTGRGGRIKWRATRTEARSILARFNVDADPDAPASSLSTPQRAMLAIARALQDLDEHEGGVLVLDEPTASLPPEEANLLLSSIRRVSDAGHAVVIVTHRLDEVRRSADRVTAVRDGRYVGTVSGRDMTEGDLVELILGRRLSHATGVSEVDVHGPPTLDITGLSGGPVRGVDVTVHPGEVVGIAGLLGSGRTELLELIYGVRRPDAGTIRIGGVSVASPTPNRMRRLGMAFIPEDRQNAAVFPEHTVAENMTGGHLAAFFQGLWLHDRRLRRSVSSDFVRYAVKASSPAALIETLSGGNQQKVVLARWLRQGPKLLLLDEPDQGIDVGSREEIFSLLAEATAAGAAVMIVSSEFEVLARLCNRIIVLAGGRIVAEHPHGIDTHDLLESVLAHAH